MFRFSRAFWSGIGLGLWLVVTSAVATGAEATATPPAAATPASLVGADKAAVIRALGKPLSTLKRGATEVLVFANGTHIEMSGGVVSAVKGKTEAVIIGPDGKRYLATAQGKVVLEAPPPPAEVAAAPQHAAVAPATAPTELDDVDVAAEDAAKRKEMAKEIVAQASAPRTPVPPPPPAVTGAAPKATLPVATPQKSSSVDTFSEKEVRMIKHGPSARDAMEKFGFKESKPAPTWVRFVSAILELVIRFGVVLLVLRIAIGQVGLSFYWPDLMKVAAAYDVVREGMHGLGEQGGMWQFITLLRVDDIVGFIALCFFLFKFKVVMQGITAMKISGAATVVAYFLMLGFGVLISFGMLALS